jgi:hypothetical protein
MPVSISKDLVGFLTVPQEELSCFDYAFCQIREKRALFKDYENHEVPGLLKSWGYQPISAKDALPGDLVLYFNAGYPMHLGVCKGGNMVQSKWGNENPLAYLHHATVAPTAYGNKMAFYRSPKSGS